MHTPKLERALTAGVTNENYHVKLLTLVDACLSQGHTLDAQSCLAVCEVILYPIKLNWPWSQTVKERMIRPAKCLVWCIDCL